MAITEGLSKMELNALRKADRVVLHHTKGLSHLEAIKDAKQTDTNPFAQEIRIDIDVSAQFVDYSEEKKIQWNNLIGFEAFELVYNYSDTWNTIVNLLKEGDELTLFWQRDALSNGNMKDARLHGDKVSLIVKRGDKKLTFDVDHSIGYDNSARMIKKVY